MAQPQDSTVVGFCREIVRSYDQLTGVNTPKNLFRKVGLLEWLRSDINMQGAELEISEGNSPFVAPQVRLVYKPRAVIADVVTDDDDYDCSGTYVPNLNKTFQITKFAGSPERALDWDTFRNLCSSTTDMVRWIQTELMREMNAIRVSINENLMTAISSSCVGVNLGNVVSAVPSAAAKSVDMLDADGNPITFGLACVIDDYAKNQLNGMAGLIGEGNLSKFSLQSAWGCCNDGGIDIGLAKNWVDRNLPYYADYGANAILGDNNFLLMAQGAAQLALYNKYARAPFRVSFNGGLATMIVPDPLIPGLFYDFKMTFTECDETFVWRIGVFYEECCWPSDVFAANDELNGMTGIMLYTAAQAA